LITVQDQRRRQDVQVARRTHDQPALLARVCDPPADIDSFREQSLRRGVGDILDTQHEAGPSNVAHDGKISQGGELLPEVRPHLAYMF
jgi:hypothetical protein